MNGVQFSSVYHGGRFLIGKAKEIVSLCELIKEEKLKLGIVLDFPQLLTAENINPYKFKVDKYKAAIAILEPHRDLIRGIHIWGKERMILGDSWHTRVILILTLVVMIL